MTRLQDNLLAKSHSNTIVALLQSSHKLRSIVLHVLNDTFAASTDSSSGVQRYVPNTIFLLLGILTAPRQPLSSAMDAHRARRD